MAQTAQTVTTRTVADRIAYAEALPAHAVPRIVGFSSPLNAYEPPDRRAVTGRGHAVTYRTATGERAMALWRVHFGGQDRWGDLAKAFYLIDDGFTVTPFYVAGHGPAGDPVMFVHPMPVNARPAIGAWAPAPARAYHVMLTRLSAFDNWHATRYPDNNDPASFWQPAEIGS